MGRTRIYLDCLIADRYTGGQIYSDFLSQAKELLNDWQNENGQTLMRF